MLPFRISENQDPQKWEHFRSTVLMSQPKASIRVKPDGALVPFPLCIPLEWISAWFPCYVCLYFLYCHMQSISFCVTLLFDWPLGWIIALLLCPHRDHCIPGQPVVWGQMLGCLAKAKQIKIWPVPDWETAWEQPHRGCLGSLGELLWFLWF